MNKPGPFWKKETQAKNHWDSNDIPNPGERTGSVISKQPENILVQRFRDLKESEKIDIVYTRV